MFTLWERLLPTRQVSSCLRPQHLHLIVHYTPTYAPWLNQVERWFGIITQRAIRRGSFSSVKQLIANIEHFIANYHKD